MRSLFLVVVLGLVPAAARAKPMLSTLESIIKSSPTIVIAKYVAPPGPAHEAARYELHVERALRGQAKETLVVKPSPAGHAFFKDGTRLVAFVNASNEWIAYAAAFAGPDLEGGVLRAAGFYDFNAHLVTPGVMTLAQLEGLVVKGTPISWTFRGPVLVGSPAGLVASKLAVAATAPKATVTGLPALAGFPVPTVDVGSWDGSDVMVTWERSLGRPLAIEGRATGKNPDGSIAVEYRLTYPGVLVEADLVRYLADARLGHPYYVLELQKAATKVPVVLDKEIGRIGTVGTAEISSTSLAPDRVIKAAGVTITLAATGFKQRSPGTTNGLVEELLTGPIRCTYAGRGGSQPCTLKYVTTRFAAP